MSAARANPNAANAMNVALPIRSFFMVPLQFVPIRFRNTANVQRSPARGCAFWATVMINR